MNKFNVEFSHDREVSSDASVYFSGFSIIFEVEMVRNDSNLEGATE